MAKRVWCYFNLQVLLLCSFSLQFLIEKMATCQLAVPLLLPTEDSKIEYMTWGLQGIQRKWQNKGSNSYNTGNMANTKSHIVSFSRVGLFSKNKSKLMNMVVSNTGMDNHTFWHEDLPGGNSDKAISNGLVELLWYLPGNKENDKFPTQTLLANLRGDAIHSPKQFQFLSETSTVNCIMLETLSDSLVDQLVRVISTNTLLVILYKADTGDDLKTQLKTLIQKSNLQRHQIIYECFDKANTAMLAKQIHQQIQILIDKSNAEVKSLSDLQSIAEKFHFSNEKQNINFTRANEYAQKILTGLKKFDPLKIKQEILPRQGNLWKTWTKKDKELYRRQKRKENTTTIDYVYNLDQEKKSLRYDQLQIPIAEELEIFIKCLVQLDAPSRRYFLQILKLGLDANSITNLSVLRDEYRRVREEQGENKVELLQQIDQQLTDGSLGLEHFFREIGQIYESLTNIVSEHTGLNTEDWQYLDALPGVVADLLLEGYPIEIMDGDAAYVAEGWIKAVMEQLGQRVPRNAKIFTLSVLGVQSTGKSTLLNTMFGLQFAVSSGRCTRGGFLQLIPIDRQLQQEIGCNFLFILDTEGLKAPELATIDKTNLHDNELATLVIGLSDLTMVNVAMESTSDVEDVLQIVVHAFLRMRTVGKQQGCHFVHQNVGSIDAKDANIRGQDNIVKKLDDMTKHAAHLEKMDGYKSFNDILEYDPIRDSTYVDSLWQGSPPMAPPNYGYSDKAVKIRTTLLQYIEDIQKDRTIGMERKIGRGLLSITNFAERLHDLWTAIKLENFIFSFRNSIALGAYSRLKNFYTELVWKIRVNLDKKVKETMCPEIMNCSLENLYKTEDDMKQDIKKYINTEMEKARQKLVDYFEKTENKEYVEDYRNKFLCIELDHFEAQCQEESDSSLSREANKRRATEELKTMDKEGENIIQQAVRKLIKTKKDKYKVSAELKGTSVDHILRNLPQKTYNALWSDFEHTWREISMEIQKMKPIGRDINIEHDVYNTLLSHVQMNSSIVHEIIREKHLKDMTFTANIQITAKDLDSKRIKILAMIPGHEGNEETYAGIAKNRISTRQPVQTSDVERANCQLQIMLEKCFNYLKHHKPMMYENMHTAELLNYIDREIYSIPEDPHFSYTPRFMTKVMIGCAAYAVIRFEQAHFEFLQNEHPLGKLEEKKEFFWNTFIALVMEADPSESFCSGFLEKVLRENVYRMLSHSELATVIRNEKQQIFASHKSLQLRVLIDLANHDDFHLYMKYIQDYQNFVLSWIKREVVKHFKAPFEQLGKQFPSRFTALAEDKMMTIKVQINEAMTKAVNSGVTTFPAFIDKMVTLLKSDTDIQINTIDIIRQKEMLHIKNIKHFVEVTQDMFNAMVFEKQKHPSWNLDSHLGNLTESVEVYLFKFISGCGATCPFCRAPCDAHTGHTAGDHSTTLHRPQGIGGYVWESGIKSGNLDEEICTDVTGPYAEKSFKNQKTNNEWQEYRNYKEVYPDWSIIYESNPGNFTYWKWVFTRHQHAFAKHYHAKKADIPLAWRFINKGCVLQNLEEIYSLNLRTPSPAQKYFKPKAPPSHHRYPYQYESEYGFEDD